MFVEPRGRRVVCRGRGPIPSGRSRSKAGRDAEPPANIWWYLNQPCSPTHPPPPSGGWVGGGWGGSRAMQEQPANVDFASIQSRRPRAICQAPTANLPPAASVL